MNLLFCLKDCQNRLVEHKKVLIFLFFAFLCSTICGIVFINTPAIYEYHLNMCDRFIDRVCYSSTSVVAIFFERTAGHALLLALLFACGVHLAVFPIAPLLLVYRGYTFGGTLYVFFSVYRVSGALIVFVLYLPVHLLFDALFLCSATLALERAKHFSFCGDAFFGLSREFALALAIAAFICLLEMLLLAALFHPLGNIL